MRLARTWLRQCLATDASGNPVHEACSKLEAVKVSQHFLPTRTINVGNEDPPRDPFIEIHDQKPQRDASSLVQWAALSHRWGGVSFLTATTETLRRMTHSIPLDSMPLTFRDAILVTRRLGIQHLWIDSLCILQDSEVDWLRESSLMASVYRFSLLNIAADNSSNSNDGILKPRVDAGTKVSLPFYSSKNGIAGTMLICPAIDNWATMLSASKSNLSSRAWVLQETFLSPRTLHFSQQQMLWECSNCIISESDMEPTVQAVVGAKLPQDDWDWQHSKNYCLGQMSQIPMQTFRKDRENWLWYNKWYNIVANYSSRFLTRPGDIFVALSGLEREFSTRTGDQTVAGLFTRDLHCGLLWHTANTATSKKAQPYRAPSWSWASVEGPVVWDSEHLLSARSSRESIQFIGYYEQNRQISTARSATEVPNLGALGVYGKPQPGTYIRLQGYLREAQTFERIQPFRLLEDRILRIYDGNAHFHVHYRLDFEASKTEFFSWQWSLLKSLPWLGNDMQSFASVILKAVPGREGTFERIGVAAINPSGSLKTRLADWELKIVDII